MILSGDEIQAELGKKNFFGALQRRSAESKLL